VRFLGMVAASNKGEQRMVQQVVGKDEQARLCYEAGPTALGHHWLRTLTDRHCYVVVPIAT
jgi:hypothetical protein